MTRPAFSLLPLLLGLAACATPRMEAEWSDPAFALQTLREAPVMVVCEAGDEATERLCVEVLVSEFKSRGLRAFGATRLAETKQGADAERYLPAAQAAGARAALVARLSPEATYMAPPASVGIGIGGGSRHFGTDIGVSMPIGSAQPRTAYSGSASLIEVASRKVMWSAKAVAPASSSQQAQIGDLARALADSAHQAGLF